MANTYNNKGFSLGDTSLTTVYTVPTGRTAIIKAIQLSNDHSSAVQVEVSYTDTSASATYKFYHADLATETSVNACLAPIVLESEDVLKIQAGTASKIEGVVSFMEVFDEKSA